MTYLAKIGKLNDIVTQLDDIRFELSNYWRMFHYASKKGSLDLQSIPSKGQIKDLVSLIQFDILNSQIRYKNCKLETFYLISLIFINLCGFNY